MLTGDLVLWVCEGVACQPMAADVQWGLFALAVVGAAHLLHLIAKV